MKDFGVLFDCGESRNGDGYVDVTNLETKEVLKVKEMMNRILAGKPVPEVELPDEQKTKQSKKK